MNIADIAKLAGVSTAAVSRYFNNGYISEEKKEAIRKVVEETGYRPSMQARTLRTKKTKLIGVIVPKMASHSIGSVVEGILSVLNENGYQVLLALTQNDPKKELEYLTTFDEKQVDGVILVATVFSAKHKKILKQMSVPVVIVGQRLSGFGCVYHDDYHAIYDMTKLILEQGRKNLSFIGVMFQDQAAGSQRYQGFKDAVTDFGREDLAENYVVADFTMESGYKKAKELLQKVPGTDAIICATDEIAVGALKYLHEQGISVPDEIMISGHGDSDLAGVVNPPLPTIHYSYEKSGDLAVHMLLDSLNDSEIAVKEVKLGYQLKMNDVGRKKNVREFIDLGR